MCKVAIVTGASRGIGAATALRLASEGYHIAVNYLANKDAADRVVELINALSVKAIAIKADISSESQVIELFNRVDAELGTPKVLINNAGILCHQSTLAEMTCERINQVFSTNITGYFLCCREAIKRMSTQKGGKGGVIVNLSSVASRTGAPGEYIDYAASKGAVDTLTIGLAAEVAAQGIRVNGVRPAFIYTDIHSSGGEAGRVDRIKHTIPLQRGGEPEEVAAAIAWLVSEESSYTTGSFIDVSGGR